MDAAEQDEIMVKKAARLYPRSIVTGGRTVAQEDSICSAGTRRDVTSYLYSHCEDHHAV